MELDVIADLSLDPSGDQIWRFDEKDLPACGAEGQSF
jgi:hypothetical protein